MKMKLSTFALLLSLAIGLGALWWWALFGMSEEVGAAWGYTWFTLFVTTAFWKVVD